MSLDGDMLYIQVEEIGAIYTFIVDDVSYSLYLSKSFRVQNMCCKLYAR